MQGRTLLFVILAVGGLSIVALFFLRGYNDTWRLWGIPTMAPNFGDARVILSGAESKRMGYDPLVNNPQDPWRRPMNYPRVWQGLAALGLNQHHTAALAVVFITFFVTGLLFFTKGINKPCAVVMAVYMFSPAVLFGVERGNNDLLMFFLLALALSAARADRIKTALLCIVLGGILKLFPFFALGVLLKENRSRFLRLGAMGVIVALLYVFLTWGDIEKIRIGTPESVRVSYGVKVFAHSFREHFGHPLVATILLLTSFAAVAALVLFALDLARRTRSEGDSPAPHLDAFRVGSSVYLASFMLFVNWDYRLMFLLFTVPQLVYWAGEGAGILRRIAQFTLVAVFFTCWSIFIRAVSFHVPHGLPLWFLLDQAAKWATFGGLLCAFVCSLPPWFFGIHEIPMDRPHASETPDLVGE